MKLLVREGCNRCEEARKDFAVAEIVVIAEYTGLGDIVASLIHALTGIKPCAACMRRRSKLNEWFPFSRVPKESRLLFNRILRETPANSQFPFLLTDTNEVVPYDPR